MVSKEQKAADFPKGEVGEIDTSVPFQSVKDAVTLFGEGAFSGDKPSIKKAKPHSTERVLAKEMQLHLARKELNKLRDKLNNAERTKAQALVELEKAKTTVNDLTEKLSTITESKDSAVSTREAAKNQAKKMEETKSENPSELDSMREQYMTVFAELDSAKQELSKIRQECDASLEAKLAAFNQAAEAEHAVKENVERVGDLSKEVSALQESIGQVKLDTLQAQEELTKIFMEKDVQRQVYQAALDESANSLLQLKKQFDLELAQNLENKLAEAMNEISSLQQQIESAKASDLDSLKTVTSGLDVVKESLQKVAEEESSLRSMVESLKLELENVKKEHSELKEKEAETESIAGNLHVKLHKVKSELEAAVAEESKVRGASEEMITTLHQLSVEAENARREAEDMKNKAEELKMEAEATRIALEGAETKLKAALREAEEAKLAEASALDQIKTLSERTTAARASTSESGAEITISREEFEALSHKVEESDSLAEMKAAAALAQVEAIKASENEAMKRLEAMQKQVEDMKASTAEVLKKAEMAEAAKRAVEGELRRWHEHEQKKAAETASRILAETEMSSESSLQSYKIQTQNTAPPKVVKVQKFRKAKTFVPTKQLLSNLSGIFQRKKYLPDEKYV